jgi:Lar family restriction alleviation protein
MGEKVKMKVKKCPFCKKTNIDYQFGTPDREGTPVNVICVECGACGPWIYAKGTQEHMEMEALLKWNERK